MAIDRVRERLLRATTVLNAAGLPYAVSGGNAVAEWIGRVDQGAVRFTQDVDLLIRRDDLPAVIDVMQRGGFTYAQSFGVDMLLDDPQAGPRGAVHLLFAGEKVRESYSLPTPLVDESETTAHFSVLSLEALVRMKLTSYRLKDRVHLQDMIAVGLIDSSWCSRFPSDLAARLRETLENPDE